MKKRYDLSYLVALLLACLGLLVAPAQPATAQDRIAQELKADRQARTLPAAPFAPRSEATHNPAAAAVFYFNDFETDDGGWTGSGFGEWEWGAVVTGVFENCDTTPEDEPSGAFSGTNVWATNLNGCYTNSNDVSILTQTFDFSALTAPIELSWQHWFEVFIPFDSAKVNVNGNLEFNITTSTPSADYALQTVDLSAYAGEANVTIEYRLFATTVVNRSGWYLDDIMITSASITDLAVAKTADNVNPQLNGRLRTGARR